VALVNPQQAISQFKVDALSQDEVVSFKPTVFDRQVIDQQEISITLKVNFQSYLDQQPVVIADVGKFHGYKTKK